MDGQPKVAHSSSNGAAGWARARPAGRICTCEGVAGVRWVGSVTSPLHVDHKDCEVWPSGADTRRFLLMFLSVVLSLPVNNFPDDAQRGGARPSFMLSVFGRVNDMVSWRVEPPVQGKQAPPTTGSWRSPPTRRGSVYTWFQVT